MGGPLLKPVDLLLGNRLALRTTVGAIIALSVLGLGWRWLRGSSLVAVEHVHIAGVHGAGAAQIRAALDDAATRMTTMDFHAGALRSAVGSYAIVGAVRVKTSFPHTVSIEVSERPPVAALVSAGQRTAVAADGTVLGPSLLSRALPTVSGSIEPVTGARVGEATTLAALAVLGAAPAPLARFVTRVYNDGPEGLTVAMRNGLLVYFGNDTRPHAKWLSLARVLTSPSSAGALYVDVRLPERPAAGFSAISGATSATVPSSGTPTSNAASSSSSVQSANADPTAAALAASLERAVGGSSTTTAATPESEASANEGESAAAGSTTSETGQSEASSEASTSTGG